MNITNLSNNGLSARFFAVLTIFSMILTAFPVAFFVANAASSSITMEVFANPVGTDADMEYIAITNNGPDELDLSGLKLDEGGNQIALSGQVDSGKTFFVCANSTMAENGGRNCAFTFSTGFNLVNGGGTIKLLDAADATILSATWGDVSSAESNAATVSASGVYPIAPPACTGDSYETNDSSDPVHNSTTGEYFTTIQNAIDDCTTVNDDTIVVVDGTYAEDVKVNKSLTINGAQAGNDARSRSGGSESVVQGGFQVTNTATEVIIDGFTIESEGSATADSAVYAGAANLEKLIVQNNIVQGGTDASFGIAIFAKDANIVIKQNTVNNYTNSIYIDSNRDDMMTVAITDNNIGESKRVGLEQIKELTLERNNFNDNLRIQYQPSAIQGSFEYNNFNDTSYIEFKKYSQAAPKFLELIAEENWWGQTTGPSASQVEIDGDGSNLSVDTDPWLCGPFETNPETSQNGECAVETVPTTPVTLCKVDEQENRLEGWQLTLLGGQDGSTQAVEATGNDYTISSVPAGNYVLKAEGTYQFRNENPDFAPEQDHNLADALFTKRYQIELDGALNAFGHTAPNAPWTRTINGSGNISDKLSLQVDGDSDRWGDVFSPSHVYYADYSHSDSSNQDIDLKITDSKYNDNAGSIDVTLYEGFTGITEQNGCVTFDAVPYGTYQIEELLQDGWENVSGLDTVTTNADAEAFSFTVVNKEQQEEVNPDPDNEHQLNLSGFKFHNRNNSNREIESGEEKLPGWDFRLYKEGDTADR